jgi:hypothetical protein
MGTSTSCLDGNAKWKRLDVLRMNAMKAHVVCEISKHLVKGWRERDQLK